jgi:hypothetical protein
MTEESKAEFRAYALDLYKHYQAWPVEFVDCDGNVHDADACWELVESMGLRFADSFF